MNAAPTSWLTLSSLAAWAIGVGAGALAFDVKLDFDDDLSDRIDIFVLAATAIIFGLMMIGMSALRKRHQLIAWLIPAVLGLSCATLLAYTYLDRRAEWTCVFAAQTRIVVGSALKPAAAAHVASTGLALAPCKVLEDYTGLIDEVWPRDERHDRHQLLAWYSYGAALSLAIAVFSIAQAFALRPAAPAAEPPVPEAP